jgi:hypothetical protein
MTREDRETIASRGTGATNNLARGVLSAATILSTATKVSGEV